MSNIKGLAESVIDRQFADLNAPDAGCRWAAATPGNVLLQGLGGAAHCSLHRAVVAVANPSAQTEFGPSGSSLGTIENALHPSVNQQ